MLGFGVGVLISVIMFQTCFQRRFYVLIVAISSLNILLVVSVQILTFLDEYFTQYMDD